MLSKPMLNHAMRIGILAMVACLSSAGSLLAKDDDDDDRQQEQERPPQVLKQGFESTDQMLSDIERAERGPKYSAWLVESTRFLNVPHRSFQPDVGDPAFVDLPVNIGIIKAPNGDITLDPDRVVMIIIGHGHWDHSGQLSEFPNAVLYVQNEELKQIDFFLDYPVRFNAGHIRAVNTIDPLTGSQVGPPQQACARSPVCGYPPQTVQEILGKVLAGKAKIVDGRHEVAPGMIIHPAFRGHTYGSQLLQVNTARGQLVFGSDTYSSWTGIRDWFVANIQQTDTIQQFLAYEKCYVLTSKQNSFNNCVSAHEPTSYTAAYPITSNWWNIPGGNCSRAAELTLANGERTHVPASPDRTPPASCHSVVPPHAIHP